MHCFSEFICIFIDRSKQGVTVIPKDTFLLEWICLEVFPPTPSSTGFLSWLSLRLYSLKQQRTLREIPTYYVVKQT